MMLKETSTPRTKVQREQLWLFKRLCGSTKNHHEPFFLLRHLYRFFEELFKEMFFKEPCFERFFKTHLQVI